MQNTSLELPSDLKRFGTFSSSCKPTPQPGISVTEIWKTSQGHAFTAHKREAVGNRHVVRIPNLPVSLAGSVSIRQGADHWKEAANITYLSHRHHSLRLPRHGVHNLHLKDQARLSEQWARPL